MSGVSLCAVPQMSGENFGFLGSGGELLAHGWAWEMQDDNLQQFNPALAVSGSPGAGGVCNLTTQRINYPAFV